MLFYDYVFKYMCMYIHYNWQEACLLPSEKKNARIQFIICFEHMFFTLENMSISEKVTNLFRKYTDSFSKDLACRLYRRLCRLSIIIVCSYTTIIKLYIIIYIYIYICICIYIYYFILYITLYIQIFTSHNFALYIILKDSLQLKTKK